MWTVTVTNPSGAHLDRIGLTTRSEAEQWAQWFGEAFPGCTTEIELSPPDRPAVNPAPYGTIAEAYAALRSA